MIKKYLMLFCAIVFLSGYINAEEAATLEQILENVKKSEQNIQSLKIEYAQQITMAYMEGKQTMIGRAYFLKPDHIRVEHLKPYEELFITNGKKVWIYSPMQNQLLIGTWDDLIKSGQAGSGSLPKGLFDFTSNISSLQKDYNIQLESIEKDAYVLLLTPKQQMKFNILLWISKAEYFPIKTSIITDTVEITTEILSVEKNLEIDKRMFKFKKPKGVDEIKLPL
ncbi:MAG: outer membrane lipoprotein carrier protein LolA [bacterium]